MLLLLSKEKTLIFVYFVCAFGRAPRKPATEERRRSCSSSSTFSFLILESRALQISDLIWSVSQWLFFEPNGEPACQPSLDVVPDVASQVLVHCNVSNFRVVLVGK